MIRLDDKYTLENNTIHGVELVFREDREGKDKDGNSKTVKYEEKIYYPNPILALSKWIELTNNSFDLTYLQSFYSAVNEKLGKIYEEFKKNGRKV